MITSSAAADTTTTASFLVIELAFLRQWLEVFNTQLWSQDAIFKPLVSVLNF